MQRFVLSRDAARLVILQRIELASPNLKKVRKLFGRYLFSKIFSKYAINPDVISKNYYNIMKSEFLTIKHFINHSNKILSIGSGMGGLEVIINNDFKDSFFTMIERNFVSKKIRYGWDNENSEAYNNFRLLEEFLQKHNIDKKKYELIDYDKQKLPQRNYDVITSLYSLDFHYDFEIYKDYLRQNSSNKTIIIFDTIRPSFFKNIFKSVEIIKEDNNTLHKSKRIACREFI
tara:strand:+ start:174 stop:866 length:693 start_codon:yes stop_codon:yes gene_type:complete